MNKVKSIFTKYPLLWIAPASFIMCYFIIYFGFRLAIYGIDSNINFIRMSRVCLFLSCVFSLAITSLIYSSGKSDEFWNISESFEKKLESSNSMETLAECENELLGLRKKAFGEAHYNKIREFSTILRVKKQYIK